MKYGLDFCFQHEECEIRLARTDDEVVKAQSLRYHIFYELMGAVSSPENAILKRDVDRFDAVCDHLLVINTKTGDVVGNYRLLCADSTQDADYFYSSQEYDIRPMLAAAASECDKVMELGRSCVHPDYRSNSILQMLWRGIVTYAMVKKAGLMFGCASFSGTDLVGIQEDLACLHHFRLAPEQWRATARPELYVPMASDMMTGDRLPKTEQAFLSKMPPLIKGYLRLGAWVGDGAVIDKDFSTTDILIILPVANISQRYLDFFGR